MLSGMRFYQSAGERAGVSRSSGYRVAVPAFASPERPDTHVFAVARLRRYGPLTSGVEAYANRYRVRPTHACIGIENTTV